MRVGEDIDVVVKIDKIPRGAQAVPIRKGERDAPQKRKDDKRDKHEQNGKQEGKIDQLLPEFSFAARTLYGQLQIYSQFNCSAAYFIGFCLYYVLCS